MRLMSDHIIGMMWNKNEGDILEEIIQEALPFVDSMIIADDGSTDNSWDIIQSMKSRFDKIEHIQQSPNRNDKAQRESMLNYIKKHYKPEDTWVQVIESDMMIAPFVDMRETLKNNTVNDLVVYWKAWNAIRKVGTWKEADTYPNWQVSIKEVMPLMHPMENMLYTFRPIKEATYSTAGRWRPWPQGFGKYISGVGKKDRFKLNSPVVIHYGYRGPTHFFEKYKNLGKRHPRYRDWNLTSPKKIEETVCFFNGVWGRKAFEPTREACRNRKRKKDD